MKSNKDAIIIILLIVVLLVVVGVLLFTNINKNTSDNLVETQNNSEQKLIEKEAEINSLKSQLEVKDKEIEMLKKANEQLSQKEQAKQDVNVEEAVNYTYEKLKVTIPKLTNCGNNGEKLNKKILNEVLKATYYRAIVTNDIENGNTPLIWGKSGFTVKYDYCIKEDVVAIYVSIVENNKEGFPGTGDGITRFNYFYDIKNDKELSFDEGVNKMKITNYVLNLEFLGRLLLIENGNFLKEYKAI